jgi:hypothetical protein
MPALRSWRPSSTQTLSLADVLITPSEARLPDADKRERGFMSGPKVLLKSPPRDATGVKSPFALTIQFERRDGVPVDLNSLIVVYEKEPPVDLTERVKAFLTSSGISMPRLKLPLASIGSILRLGTSTAG